MNEQPKTLWEKFVAEPRRFFLWLAVVSLAVLVLLFVVGNAFRHTQPSSLVRSAAAFVMVGTTGSFLAGFFGFFLSLIPPLKPLFRWVVRRSVFLAACLITLVALFYAQENWRGKRAWENFQREGMAKGERFDLAAIIPPPVPDAQNVAAASLFKDLCNEFDPEWRRLHSGTDGVVTNAADRLKLKYTRTNDSGPENAGPNWQKGQRTDLKAWQDYYRNPIPPQAALRAQAAFAERYGLPAPATEASSPTATTNEFPTTPQPQAPAADVLLALSKHDALVEELRAASERPHSRFPIHYEDGFSAQLPHLARLKGINQVLVLRAAAELEAGQLDKAADDVRLGLRMADVTLGEPLLISQLVRLAQMQIALNPIWEGLVGHRWTDAQLAGFERQLSQSDFLADYQLGMRGERGFCMWTIDYMHRQRDMIDELAMPETATDPESAMLERIVGPALLHLIPKGWFQQNKVSIGRMHLGFILPAVNHEAGLVSPSAVQKMSVTMGERLKHRSPYNWFGAMLLPALGNASDKFARGQAGVDLARVALALERHRLARGQYPETLDALAPQFIAKVPHDVIGGQPLKYRRMDGGTFSLYSIGWNEKDDGGMVVLSKDQRSVDWKNGDWVWQMPAR